MKQKLKKGVVIRHYLTAIAIGITIATPVTTNRINAHADKTMAVQEPLQLVQEIPEPQLEKKSAVAAVEEPKPKTLTGSKYEWMAMAGIPKKDWAAVDYIIHHESTWRVSVTNKIGCIGLAQNCPDKYGRYWLKEACPNWQNDPVCQLKRFTVYAEERYGSWSGALAFWQKNSWW